MIRQFKSEWRDAASSYARSLWHSPDWRYFDVEDSDIEKSIEAAMGFYRSQLSGKFTDALKRPRSKAAMTRVLALATELASVGNYALERAQSNGKR